MMRRRVSLAALVVACSIGAASSGWAVLPPDPLSPATFDAQSLTTCAAASFGGQATTTVNFPPVHVDKDVVYGGAGSCKSATNPINLTAGAVAKLYWFDPSILDWVLQASCNAQINQNATAAAVCQYINNSMPIGLYDAVFCITPNISPYPATCAHSPFTAV